MIKVPAAGLQAGEPLTLAGTGTPGMRVQVADGARVVGEAVVGPDGTWQVTVPPLAAGTHSLVAKQVGADDTVQGASAPLELTVADGQIVVATPAVAGGSSAATHCLAHGCGNRRRGDCCGNGSQRPAVNRRDPGRQCADGCDAGRCYRRCGRRP